MAQQKGADQTEPPTQKKLRDAVKEGNVAKSRELTSTVVLMIWLATAWLLTGHIYQRLTHLSELVLANITRPFDEVLPMLTITAFEALVWLSVPILLPMVAIGLLTDFLQVGPVMAFKRVKPDLANLNPVEGVKRMFTLENVVEVVKAGFKSGALILIFLLVLWPMLGDILILPFNPPVAMGAAYWHGVVWIGVWTIFVFFFVSVLDVSFQKHAHIKKLRMSRRDIKQESKENEGDPQIKGKRRQLHEEWSQQNVLQAVRGSSVVVTNPTHIAVAILYEQGSTDLPMVVAKGEDHMADLIRRTAEEAGVPIMQNIPLARGLHADVELDHYISPEFFEAVAEVLMWAETVRRERD